MSWAARRRREDGNEKHHDCRRGRPGHPAGQQAAGPDAAGPGLRREGQRGPRHEPAGRQRGHLCALRGQGLLPHHRQGAGGRDPLL